MAHHDPQPPAPPQDEREARLQRILREIEKQLRAGLPDPDQPLERIEQEVVEIGRTLREIIERETLDAAGSGYVGSQAVCACSRAARHVTLNRRTLVTLNGERTFTRAYYHCAACGQGFCPLDQRWQLGRGEQSVGVRALAARFNSAAFTKYWGWGCRGPGTAAPQRFGNAVIATCRSGKRPSNWSW